MRRASLFGAAVLVLLLKVPSFGSYMWESRVQVTDTATGYSALARHLVPHYGSSNSLHHIVRHWNQTQSCNDGVGYYLSATNTTGWADAWQAAWADTERFTYVPGDTGQNGQSALNMVIDDANDVHVFYEAKFYPGHATVEVAYKRRGDSDIWHPDSLPVFVTPQDCGCYAHNPYTCLDDSTRMLHLVCDIRCSLQSCVPGAPDTMDARLYTSKSLDSLETAWPDPSYIIESIRGPIVVANGKVHFFGKREKVGQGADTLYVVHRSGEPPGAGNEWNFDEVDTLDIYEKSELPGQGEEESIEGEPHFALSESGDLHFVWHRFEDSQVKEVYFATLDLGDGTWWPDHTGEHPWGYCLSRADTVHSGAPSLVTADNGTVHVMYHEPGAGDFGGPGDADFYHLYNATDVTDTTAWSYPSLVSSEKKKDAKAPNMVVEGDAVWVSYSDYGDDSFDAWFRTGEAIGDTAAAGSTTIWDGTIVLDADFYIPEKATLQIEEGTLVLASPHHDRHDIGGDTTRVEIIVDGKLIVDGTAAKPVVFAPMQGDSTSGDGWGGIYLDWTSAGSTIEYADFWGAPNPIFVYYPDSSTTIENCRIHHFKDYGIWMYGALGDGAVIKENTIERGDSLGINLGKVGILVNRAPMSVIEDNTVQMIEGSRVTAGAGIRVQNTYEYCLEYTETPDTLIVRENALLGPDDPEMGDDAQWSGLHLHWGCGIGGRDVLVEKNTIRNWNNVEGIGIELDQCIDVQVSCNVVDTCMVGVDLSRTEKAADSLGAGVRFRNNLIESTEELGKTLVTDNAKKMKLGPNFVGKGLNKFLRTDDLGYFIEQNDADTTRTLDARANEWILNATSYTLADSVVAHCTSIAPDTTDPLGRIDLRDMKNNLQIPCLPGGSIARRGPAEGVAPEGRPGVVDLGEALARVGVGDERGVIETTLGRPYPTPFRTWTRVPFSIASEVPKRAIIEVFDVQGRRIGTPMDRFLGRGAYELTWDGRGASGRRLASGVYFLRFAVSEYQEVRKIVVVH